MTGSGENDQVKDSSLVSVYNVDGWVEDLPKLNMGRYYHGCGHYINSANKMVGLIKKYFDPFIVNFLISKGVFSERWKERG